MSWFAGKYPGAIDAEWTIFGGAPGSDLDPIAFMQGFSGKNIILGDRPLSFDTILSAIEKAGLTEFYSHGGPFILLAPTDAAFTSMPAADREALLADPVALANMLHAHTITGYIPRGNLAMTPGGDIGSAGKHFTSLAGTRVKIGSGFTINGVEIGDFDSYFLANGSSIHPISVVELPQP